MNRKTTPEQNAIIEWLGNQLVVNAFAVTGKTATLVQFAQANPDSKMLYLAYKENMINRGAVTPYLRETSGSPERTDHLDDIVSALVYLKLSPLVLHGRLSKKSVRCLFPS